MGKSHPSGHVEFQCSVVTNIALSCSRLCVSCDGGETFDNILWLRDPEDGKLASIAELPEGATDLIFDVPGYTYPYSLEVIRLIELSFVEAALWKFYSVYRRSRQRGIPTIAMIGAALAKVRTSGFRRLYLDIENAYLWTDTNRP